MHVPLPQMLTRLGKLPALKFVLVFAGLQALFTVVLTLALEQSSPGAAAAAVWGLRLGVLLVFSVAAFYREDDPLECGLLAAGVLLLGGGVAKAILVSIEEGTLMAGFVQIIFAPMGLIPAALLYVPICAGLIWFARKAFRVSRLPE